jgi:hypothetical protein
MTITKSLNRLRPPTAEVWNDPISLDPPHEKAKITHHDADVQGQLLGCVRALGIAQRSQHEPGNAE